MWDQAGTERDGRASEVSLIDRVSAHCAGEAVARPGGCHCYPVPVPWKWAALREAIGAHLAQLRRPCEPMPLARASPRRQTSAPRVLSAALASVAPSAPLRDR